MVDHLGIQDAFESTRNAFDEFMAKATDGSDCWSGIPGVSLLKAFHRQACERMVDDAEQANIPRTHVHLAAFYIYLRIQHELRDRTWAERTNGLGFVLLRVRHELCRQNILAIDSGSEPLLKYYHGYATPQRLMSYILSDEHEYQARLRVDAEALQPLCGLIIDEMNRIGQFSADETFLGCAWLREYFSRLGLDWKPQASDCRAAMAGILRMQRERADAGQQVGTSNGSGECYLKHTLEFFFETSLTSLSQMSELCAVGAGLSQ